MRHRHILMLAALAVSGCGGEAAVIAGGAGVVYYAQDGFTWEVEDRLVAPDTYRITIRQGRFKISGAGEAEAIFKRRAADIAAIQGCTDYTILEYRQGLDSDPIGIAQRISEGRIRCNRPPVTETPRT